MKYPVPKIYAHFAACIGHFAAELGLSLTNDEAMDMTGHLLGPQLYAELHEPSDWHCILWNRDVALTSEIYSLASSAPEALATVLTLGDEEDQELDPVECHGNGMVVRHDGQIYATIYRPTYKTPRSDLLQRIETILAPLVIADERGLLRRLANLPAWTVEPYNSMPLYSSLVVPIRSPRDGEWRAPLSFTFGEEVTSDTTAAHQLERPAAVQSRLPMWVTPSSAAKTLQTLLAERLAVRPKLSRCQETMARAYGLDSWQIFLARYRQCVFLQATRQMVCDETQPQLQFYRSAAELLACVYGEALQRLATDDAPMHISIGWLMDANPVLTWRDCAVDDIRARLVAMAGPDPTTFSYRQPEHEEVTTRWDDLELQLRCAAKEWRSDKLFIQTGLYGNEHLRQALEQLGRLVPAELEETLAKYPGS